MRKWIDNERKPNILVFNENSILNQYISSVNANFYMLYVDNNSYLDPPSTFYKLYNKRVPVDIDNILITNPDKLPLARNIKISMDGEPVIIGCYDEVPKDQGEVNIFDNVTDAQTAKASNFNNVVFIPKYVDIEFFKKNSASREKKLLCFDIVPDMLKDIVDEKSIRTFPPICGQYRRDLYSKNSAFLNLNNFISYEVLEAMACEIPIITSYESVRTQPHLIIHGINGYLYKDAGEIKGFFEILDDSLINYMGGISREKIGNPSLTKIVDEWNKLLLNIKAA